MKITKTLTLETEEYGDFTFVKRPDLSFILLTKDVPKNSKNLWNFNKWDNVFSFWSDKYLASYHEGNWGDYDENDADDKEERLWAKRDFTNLYKGNPSEDGFLYNKDGTPLRRKIQCEFWRSYYPALENLEKELKKRKKWSNINVERTPYYNVSICGIDTLNASYLPTQTELNKWFARKGVSYGAQDLGGSYGVLHNFKYIAKYRREEK